MKPPTLSPYKKQMAELDIPYEIIGPNWTKLQITIEINQLSIENRFRYKEALLDSMANNLPHFLVYNHNIQHLQNKNIETKIDINWSISPLPIWTWRLEYSVFYFNHSINSTSGKNVAELHDQMIPCWFGIKPKNYNETS